MYNILLLNIAIATFTCVYAAGNGTTAETGTRTALYTADGCPPGWHFDKTLCLSSDISKEECAALHGLNLLGICLKRAVSVTESAPARKEFRLGVFFKEFKRFCCGHGFGR